jgi:DNA segregation ATPase FtsK/SpoIIIE, S-DNA-T family
MNPELLKLLGPSYSDLEPNSQSQVLAILLKLTSLGFVASFKHVEKGPIVNTYFFEPSSSSSLSKIDGREEDLAMVLKVESIILGRDKGEITIAVPRTDRELIKFDACLMQLLQNKELHIKYTLPILMGKTTKGEELYVDLSTQPHLLIAGTTGSGKSIFTSQLICSLALLHSPKELEFILVDTKRLDLVLFEGLPHISKVLTDIHGLRLELESLLQEVRDRTETMSGVSRNIQEWNKGFGASFKYKILIIDEFADVLDSDREYLGTLHPKMRPSSIADLVKRLAQISRAAGIHIIIATQRPSVKVVSGDIKTNFPFRIAFKLPTMQDSRVVLDENGAERLLGKGDYLYKTAQADTVKRAHSAYVSINDIATIIQQSEFLRSQYVTGRVA